MLGLMWSITNNVPKYLRERLQDYVGGGKIIITFLLS